MASFRGRIRHKLFSSKKKVKLGHLSPADGLLVTFTAIRASSGPLKKMSSKGFKPEDLPKLPQIKKAVYDTLSSRRGSVYAAFMTSVDHNSVFHGDQFAIAIKRLGVSEDLSDRVQALGFDSYGEALNVYAPWFWADLVARELATVKRESKQTVLSSINVFKEDITKRDLDCLLEAAVYGTVPSGFGPSLAQGIGSLETRPDLQNKYYALSRDLLRSPVVEILDKNSSFEAIFETFYQHLLANSNALRKLLPSVRLGSKKLNAQDLERIFRKDALKQKLYRAFSSIYDAHSHSLRLNRLDRAMEMAFVRPELVRAARQYKLEEKDAHAILSGVVALFYAFVGDSKGRMLPIMKTLR